MPEGKCFSCRCSISGNVSLALTNYSLLDQTSARWTVIHSCRRPHKIPAHTFKELRNRPQRLLPSARRFRPSEPPIIAGFSASSTPRFEVRLRRSNRKPEGFSSKRAAYYGSLFVAVNTCVRVTSTSCLRCQPLAGGEGAEVCNLFQVLGRGKYTSPAHPACAVCADATTPAQPPGLAVSITTPSSLPASATFTRRPSARAIR